MSKKTIVTVLGATIIVLPFLGLPNSFFTIVLVLIGLGIIYIARSGTKKRNS